MEATQAKRQAAATVDTATESLVALSRAIHDRPELCFEEHEAAERVGDALAGAGFAVDRGPYDLPTALEARAGPGPLSLVICAEYDALPGIGHACGHNLIAAAAVGAGLALAPLADHLGLSVRVLGTPAEEGGGGKIMLLERGAFAGAHAAMMVHPWPDDHLSATCLAVDHFAVSYRGRDAHASASPERGSTPPTPSWWPRWPSACSASTCAPATRSTASWSRRGRRPTSSRTGRRGDG